MESFKNKTVVVPFDFSEQARKAIDATISMADESTSLHVVYVVEPTYAMISVDAAMSIPPTNDEKLRSNATEEMNKLFGEGKYKGLKQHCKIGDPGSSIVELADKLGANLIVMPSHGRTGLARLFLGSVAERVLRLANCPVLILRGEDWQ